MTREDYFRSIANISELIELKKEQLCNFLSLYETRKTAYDEIRRSLSTLNGFRNEFTNKLFTQEMKTAVFFPLNLPLYSLILFAVAPCYFCDTIYVRCPVQMRDVLAGLMDILDMNRILPNINIINCSRTIFLYKYVKNKSDIIIFTGKNDNANNILKAVGKDKLFIMNGSGINPVVVFEDADVKEAAEKSCVMRTYNSGQDCAGPDVFFVCSKIADEFCNELKKRLAECTCGEYNVKDFLDIGPIQKDGYVNVISIFLQNQKKNIVHNGCINGNLITPYIIRKKISEHNGEFDEFFAPIFYILVFDTDKELNDLIYENSDKVMYLTYFSKIIRFENINFAVKIKNKIIDEVEQGNKPYGGYGSKTSYVCKSGRIEPKPILISREIDHYLKDIAKRDIY